MKKSNCKINVSKNIMTVFIYIRWKPCSLWKCI